MNGIVSRVVVRMGWLALLLSGMAACSNVVTPTTTAEREAAFAPYRDRSIEGVPLADYLANRTAFVITGTEITEVKRTANTGGPGVDVQFPGSPDVGSATMIDSRGYFLTAAHVAEKKPITLFFDDGSAIQHYPVRVVWNGHDAPGKPDLAVVHVDARLPATFQWAQAYQAGGPALSSGLNRSGDPNHPNFTPGFSAGKLLSAPPASASSQETTQAITHDLPIHHGDSGGPLVNAQGQLIGINVRINLKRVAYVGPLHQTSGAAIRPDLAWLRRVIEADFSKISDARGADPARH